MLRIALESTRAQLAYLDRDFNFVWVNNAYAEGSGHAAEELAGKNHFAFFPDPENQAIFERVRDTGEAVKYTAKPFEFADQPERGVTYWDWTLSPVKDAAGRVRGLVLSLIDVTERERDQAALRSLTHDLDERIKEVQCLYALSSLLDRSDLPLAELLRGAVALLPPAWQYPEVACARIVLAVEVFETPNWEETAWRQTSDILVDGERLGTVEVGYLEERPEYDEGPFLKEERELLGTVARHLADAVEHRRADERIRTQGEFLQSTVDSLSHPFYVIDAESYTIRMANAASGLSELPATSTCYQLTHGASEPCGGPEHACPLQQVVDTKRPVTVEHTHTQSDGSIRVFEIHCHPILGNDGKVAEVIEYNLDITERKRALDALLESERELAIRNEISDIFLTTPDDEIYAEVLRVVLEALQSKHGVFGYVDENGAVVYPSMTRDVWEQCRVPEKNIVFPRETWGGIWGRALTEKKSLWSNEAFRVPEGHIPMRRAGFVPIIHRRRVIGLLGVANKAADYDENDLRLLEVIAGSVAPILAARLQRDREERDRRAAEDELRESEERYRFLAEGAQDVIWLYRLLPEVLCEYVNPAAETVLGYAPDEYYRDPDLRMRLVHPEDRAVYEEFVRHPQSFADRPLTLRRICKDGSVVWTEEHNSLVLDQQGAVTAIVAIVRDISERIQSEEELERLRSEFLGMVTHELKTPLTAIKGSAATVLGSKTPLSDAAYRELFEIVDQQADRLRGLADDLLDMTRIETGTLSVSPQRVDLHEILEQARTVFAHSGRSQCLDAQIPDELPCVFADGQRMIQVITNLLNNAAQFSSPAGIIELLAEHDGVEVTVRVRDHGRGIAPEKLPELFKKFSQVHEAGTRRLGGAGLGLAISKGIIESHGGRIWAESAGEGQGATFSFTLPAADAVPAEERPASRAAPGRRRGKKTRVLAIDDEPQILNYLRRSLGDAGHEALLTSEPAELVSLAELEEPDIVLLDIRLPGTSGFELFRRIREFSTVPVIFLTASDRDEDVVRALEIGADDYIKKPFSPSEVLARIQVALKRRNMQEKVQDHQPFVLGDLKINFAERRVWVKDRPVSLSATEYKILVELASHAGLVLTHDQILQRVWGPHYSGETELVRSFVRYLRRKLGDDARRPRFIFTEPQVGYRMPKPEV